jgi:phospholipase/carboxylesterase
MRWTTRILLVCCLSAAVVCTSEHRVASKGKSQLVYIERVLGGADPAAKLPLVVAIHGLGDKPDNFLEVFDELDLKVRIVAPRAPDPWYSGASWYPYFEPPAKKLPIIRARADLLAAFIGELRGERPSLGRTIVTGFSQGGVMSFALAAFHPGLLEAALPVAGMLDGALPEPVPITSPLPVFAFHGTADDRVMYADGAASVERLKKAGRAAKLTSYPGLGHAISPALRRDLFRALGEAVAAARTRKEP